MSNPRRACALLGATIVALSGGCRERTAAAPRSHATEPPVVVIAAGSARPSRERPRILIEIDTAPRGFRAVDAGIVAESVPEVEIVTVSKGRAAERISGADGFVGVPTRELLRAAPGLRWIQAHDGGVDRYLFPEMLASPAILTNAKIIKGPAMADHAMALLLALTRQIPRSVAAKSREESSNRGYAPIELQGKTALIVGLGGAGTQIAERAFASGMRVIASDPKEVPFMRAVDRVEKPEMLHELLPLADVVFIAAPLTSQTRRLFRDPEFALLKPGAYFVNISRGGLVDTDALVRALKSGHLAGAGLDVVIPDRLPKGHPLWRMDNVVITPHIAGGSDHGLDRRRQLIIENARRFAHGLPLRNVVDKQLGY